MHEIQQGQFYRHFKGRLCQIVAVAEHSETGELMIVYQALYGDYRIYVCSYESFASEVDHERYPDAVQKFRFELADPSETGKHMEMTKPLEAGQTFSGDGSVSGKKPEKELTAAEPEDSQDQENGQINPILLKFLDAETFQEKMHIMVYYRNQMDDNLLNSIAISLDVVVEKKKLQDKYDEIMSCLSTMERFEVINRRR